MANKANKEKDIQPRIVIDCTKKQHADVKAYCAIKEKKIKEFGLEAILEKMEREP